MSRQLNASFSYENWINLFIFLSGALVLTFKNGYMIGLIGLSVTGILDLWKNKSTKISPPQKKIILLFIIYFISQVVFILNDDVFKLSNFDLPSRALTAILIFLLISRNNIRFPPLANGIACGAIIGGSIAIYEKMFLHWNRAFDNIMPIQAGDTCMTLGLLSLCFFFHHLREENRKSMALFFLASVLGITGSLLSGSRGGWILLPVNIIAIFKFNQAFVPKNLFRIFFAAFMAMIVLCFIPSTGIPQRISLAAEDLHRVADQQWTGNDGTNSLGIRLLLWQSNWESFTQKPLMGWGENGINHSYISQYENGRITGFIRDYGMHTHAHNQFLDEMAKKGIAGLLSFLSILLIPVWVFYKEKKSSLRKHSDSFCIPGIILIFSMLDYCLSQAFFNHNSGISYYFLSVSILLGYVLNTKNGYRETKEAFHQ